jgi:hypothetical protein
MFCCIISVGPMLWFFKAHSRSYEKQLLASSCLSVRPHGPTRLPLEELTWNWMSEDFS